MPLRDDISKLREITLTPNISLNSSELMGLINKLSTLLPIKHPRWELTKDDLQFAIGFFVCLPHSTVYLKAHADSKSLSLLSGSLIIHPCIIYLITNAVESTGISEESISTLGDLLAAWHDLLKHSPSAKTFLRPPDIEESPLFRFHLESFNYAKPTKTSIPYLYHAYASRLHTDLRHNETIVARHVTHTAYVLSARYFMKYLSAKYKFQSHHPSSIPALYVADFARQLDIALAGNYDGELSDLAATHRERFKRLITRSPIKSHPHDGPESSGPPEGKTKKRKGISPEPLDGTPSLLSSSDSDPDIEKRVLDIFIGQIEESPEEKEAAEYEAVEHQIYIANGEDDIVPQRPSLKRLHDHIRLGNFHFSWDSTFHNMFHYALIYSVLPTLWDSSPRSKAMTLLTELLIHTGIEPLSLIELSTGPEETLNASPILKDINGLHYIAMKSIIKPMRTPKEGNCLPTSDFVFTPIPHPIGMRLRTVIPHGSHHVFSYRAEDNRIKRISIGELDDFLAKMANNSFARYNIRITSKSLSRSFLPLYHSRGLDPLLAILIRCKDFNRLYKTRLHYINVGHHRLEQEYLQTYHRVSSDILTNLSDCRAKGFVVMDDQSELQTTRFLSLDSSFPRELPTATYPTHSHLPHAYGSPIIPSLSYIKGIISALSQTIIETRDVISRHNLYICYLYLGLQFATAHRPRNDPDIAWEDVTPEFDLIALSDKQSACFHEERFTGLPRVIGELMVSLRDGLPRLKKYLAVQRCPGVLSYDNRKIFSFVERETGHFCKFTLGTFRQTLSDAGVYYTLPLNMPRHVARHHLQCDRVPHDIAESWMGHHHPGKESLGTSSAALPSTYNGVIKPCIEALLESVGYGTIPYLPRSIS